MGDWLGTGNVSNRDKEFLPFKEGREIVHQLGLKSSSEWKKYTESDKYDKMIPKAPHMTYKEFLSMGDWLGTGNVSNRDKEFLPFREGREIAQQLGLKSSTAVSYTHLTLPTN